MKTAFEIEMERVLEQRIASILEAGIPSFRTLDDIKALRDEHDRVVKMFRSFHSSI